MRNFTDEICRENKKTRFVLKKFFPEIRAVYEVIKKVW
jgi:RNA:NAD 2'-phosphotransferase (TPT1/KptA family)